MKRSTMFLLTLCIVSRASFAQSTIVGTVFDSLHSHAGLAHATVVIPELPRYTTTDSRGRFRFDSVPAGRFSITFLHATLDSLDMAAPTVPIVTSEKGTVNTALAIPSPRTVYAYFCPGPRDRTTGFLVGRVRDVDDASPLTQSTVTAAWTDFTFEQGKLQAQPELVSSVSNAAGVYVLCGMPEDLSLEVFARSGDFVAGPVPVLLDSTLAQRVNLAVSRRDSAARWSSEQLGEGATESDTARAVVRGSARIVGTVQGDQNRPLPGATAALHGASATARTDSSGRFRLSQLPAGTHAVDVRSLGSAPATFIVDLKSGAELDTTIRLDRAQILRPVSVVERRATVDKTGFAERQRMGIGHFMDAADIDRLPTANVFSLLHRIPTIHQTQVDNTQLLRMRGGSVAKNGHFAGVNLCLPTFFIDEQLVPLDPGPDPYGTIKSLAPVEDITGIEVYTPAERIPAWADRSWQNGCGSVIIWTKWMKKK